MIAIVGLAIIVGLAVPRSHAAEKTRTRNDARTVEAPPTSTLPAGPIFTQAGRGFLDTTRFRVPDDWDLAWSYDCSMLPGGTGRFGLVVFDIFLGRTTLAKENPAVRQSGANGSGTEHYRFAGGRTKYLRIETACHWTVTATAA